MITLARSPLLKDSKLPEACRCRFQIKPSNKKCSFTEKLICEKVKNAGFFTQSPRVPTSQDNAHWRQYPKRSQDFNGLSVRGRSQKNWLATRMEGASLKEAQDGITALLIT